MHQIYNYLSTNHPYASTLEQTKHSTHQKQAKSSWISQLFCDYSHLLPIPQPLGSYYCLRMVVAHSPWIPLIILSQLVHIHSLWFLRPARLWANEWPMSWWLIMHSISFSSTLTKVAHKRGSAFTRCYEVRRWKCESLRHRWLKSETQQVTWLESSQEFPVTSLTFEWNPHDFHLSFSPKRMYDIHHYP